MAFNNLNEDFLKSLYEKLMEKILCCWKVGSNALQLKKKKNMHGYTLPKSLLFRLGTFSMLFKKTYYDALNLILHII